jgi:hypothetical protein
MNQPQGLKVTELTQDELDALAGTGRIVGDRVVPAADEKPAEQAAKVSVPVPPPGVIERIKTAKKLETSFTHETEGPRPEDNAKKVGGTDGGASAAGLSGINPDWATKEAEQPVEADDKKKFLALLLGAPFFSKSYKLFDGNIEVTFRTRSAAEEEECGQQTYRDERRDGLVGPAASEIVAADRLRRLRDYQFTAALMTLQSPGGVPRIFKPFEAKTKEDDQYRGAIRVAYDQLLKDLPHPLVVALRTEWVRFEILVAKMTLNANNPDFWKAVSGT